MEKKKNLLVRNSIGRVIEFLEGGAEYIEEFRFVEEKGCELEVTDDRYVNKFGKWWLTE